MPFAEATDHSILNHFFGKVTWPVLADNRYIGLSSTTPTKTGGNVTEPSAGAYARIQLLNTEIAVPAASTTSNNTDKTFVTATADWLSGVNLTDMVMFDAVTAGTFLAFKSLTVAKPVLNGDTAKFANGDMDFTIAGAA